MKSCFHRIPAGIDKPATRLLSALVILALGSALAIPAWAQDADDDADPRIDEVIDPDGCRDDDEKSVAKASGGGRKFVSGAYALKLFGEEDKLVEEGTLDLVFRRDQTISGSWALGDDAGDDLGGDYKRDTGPGTGSVEIRFGSIADNRYTLSGSVNPKTLRAAGTWTHAGFAGERSGVFSLNYIQTD